MPTHNRASLTLYTTACEIAQNSPGISQDTYNLCRSKKQRAASQFSLLAGDGAARDMRGIIAPHVWVPPALTERSGKG